MKKTAFITGADRGLGLALCKALLQKGWKVSAGQYMPDWTELTELAKLHPDDCLIVPLDVASLDSVRRAADSVTAFTESVDLLINNAALQAADPEVKIREAQNYDEILRLYNVNSLGPLRMVQEFLNLVEKSSMKRLCFLSSEASSISASSREGWFAYCMSKSALNMAVKNLFNELNPKGFSFRLYHPGFLKTYMLGHLNEDGELSSDEAAERALNFFLNALENEGELAMWDYDGNKWPW